MKEEEDKEKVKSIWKHDELIADDLANIYYDSIIDEYSQKIKKDSKENFGFNAFVDGIKLSLDIIMPLLNDEERLFVESKIKAMIERREKLKSLEKEKMSIVNCSFCKKEIECPESMLSSKKHICHDCFIDFDKKLTEEDMSDLIGGKLHFDLSKKRLEEEMPKIFISFFMKETFPKIMSQAKEDMKDMSKKEICRAMFQAGLMTGLGYDLDNLDEEDGEE